MEDLLNSQDPEMFNLGMQLLFQQEEVLVVFPTITNTLLFDWMSNNGHMYKGGDCYLFKKFNSPHSLLISTAVIHPYTTNPRRRGS